MTFQNVQSCVSGIKSSVISGSHAGYLEPANKRVISATIAQWKTDILSNDKAVDQSDS